MSRPGDRLRHCTDASISICLRILTRCLMVGCLRWIMDSSNNVGDRNLCFDVNACSWRIVVSPDHALNHENCRW